MKEMTSAELAEAIKNGTDTVIIPGGAYEVYGPQLPLGSDTIVSLAVCERVAAKTNAIIGPCFEVGESASLYQFPGTIKIMPDTYYRVMEDIIDSLAHWGFKNFMFINMHAGNVPIISQLPGRSSASTASSAIRWTGGASSSPTPRTSARIRAGVPTAMPVRAAPA